MSELLNNAALISSHVVGLTSFFYQTPDVFDKINICRLRRTYYLASIAVFEACQYRHGSVTKTMLNFTKT